MDMADHPEGADLSKEQAVVVVCSTQVWPWQQEGHVGKKRISVLSMTLHSLHAPCISFLWL